VKSINNETEAESGSLQEQGAEDNKLDVTEGLKKIHKDDLCNWY